jgi:hypothetical protein
MQKNNENESAWCGLDVKGGWGNKDCVFYEHWEAKERTAFINGDL